MKKIKNEAEEKIRYQYIYETKAGRIRIADNGKAGEEAAITRVDFLSDVPEVTENQAGGHAFSLKETPVIQEAARQLGEYLAGARIRFQLPYELNGTDFQMKVWNALREIPYGEVRTYREIAERVGSPRACRAVGQANHNNPVGIFIPCHRVIGSSGRLTGYAGGIDKKEWLLALERANVHAKDLVYAEKTGEKI